MLIKLAEIWCLALFLTTEYWMLNPELVFAESLVKTINIELVVWEIVPGRDVPLKSA